MTGPTKKADWGVRSARKVQEERDRKKAEGLVGYLGTTVGPANTNAKEGTRQEVRKTLVQVIRTIGRIPCLSNEQMSKCMSVAVSGIVGYWGRSTPLRMDDMQAAEAARAVAVQQR
eukprot:1433057-Prymnesium_polylepis.1